MVRSITEALYLAPKTRTGAPGRVSEENVKDLEDDAVLYSIRGEAPEGWYNAGTKKHYSKGSGYEDHQIFKKLPTAQASENKNEPVKEKKVKENKNQTTPEVQAAVPPSQEVTEAKERINAYKTTDFGAYGPKKSAFAERSSEIYDPNEDFQAYGQSSVTSDGNQQAQAFAKSKLSDVKNKYNFQPTLT